MKKDCHEQRPPKVDWTEGPKRWRGAQLRKTMSQVLARPPSAPPVASTLLCLAPLRRFGARSGATFVRDPRKETWTELTEHSKRHILVYKAKTSYTSFSTSFFALATISPSDTMAWVV